MNSEENTIGWMIWMDRMGYGCRSPPPEDGQHFTTTNRRNPNEQAQRQETQRTQRRHGYVSDLEQHYARQDSKLGLFVAGIVMASAIALHNVPEGMTIGASYASNDGVMGSAALVLAVLIGLHNIPEGMAVSVPLISGGMAKWKAVLITAASGIPTILGALLGYLLGEIGPLGLTMSLGFASGAMLYVVFGEILPQSILMYHSKLPAFSAITGILVGILIIF